MVDAVIALQIVVSGEYDGDAADMDGDGRVTSVDVLTILWTAVAVYTNLMVVQTMLLQLQTTPEAIEWIP